MTIHTDLKFSPKFLLYEILVRCSHFILFLISAKDSLFEKWHSTIISSSWTLCFINLLFPFFLLNPCDISKHCDPPPLTLWFPIPYQDLQSQQLCSFAYWNPNSDFLGEIVCRSILWKRRYRQDKNRNPDRRAGLIWSCLRAAPGSLIKCLSRPVNSIELSERKIISLQLLIEAQDDELSKTPREVKEIFFSLFLCWGRGVLKTR